MYGSGLRLMKAVRLRVQDINFDYHCIEVWNGKAGKYRTVTLVPELTEALKNQISQVSAYYVLRMLTTLVSIYLLLEHENIRAQLKYLIGIIYFHQIEYR